MAWQQCGNGKRYLQLQQIKEELRFPYRDKRPPFRGHSEDRVFELISGETDATLRPGLPVTGTVVAVTEVAARVKLDQLAVMGYVHRSRMPGVAREQDMTEAVALGTAIKGVVTEVEKPKVSVRVSCLPEDTMDRPWPRPESLPRLDRRFDERRALEDYRQRRSKAQERLAKAQEGQQQQARGRRVRRVDHPDFRKLNFKQAEEYLVKNNKPGEHMFRPSNTGGLSLSWHLCSGIVLHVPVEEQDKREGEALGRRLKIKDKVFMELDQIVAQYVTPMNDLVDTVLEHRRFINKPREEVEARLKEEKRRHPNQVFYAFFPDHKRPGSFGLLHIVSAQMFREPVEVTPRGLMYRGQAFRSAEEVAQHFKQHRNEAIPVLPRGSAPTPRNGAPPTPLQQPAPREKVSRWEARAAPPPPAWQQQQPPPPPPPMVVAPAGEGRRPSRWG